jgi:hypothetical protein
MEQCLVKDLKTTISKLALNDQGHFQVERPCKKKMKFH